MQRSAEVDLGELAEVFWDELVERLITTDPHCADLFDEMAGHDLDLRVSWNTEDGAVTGTLRCSRCAAVAAWCLTASISGVRGRRSQLSAQGDGNWDLDDSWKKLACFNPPPGFDEASDT